MDEGTAAILARLAFHHDPARRFWSDDPAQADWLFFAAREMWAAREARHFLAVSLIPGEDLKARPVVVRLVKQTQQGRFAERATTDVKDEAHQRVKLVLRQWYGDYRLNITLCLLAVLPQPV
jgi:hypothetical protein